MKKLILFLIIIPFAAKSQTTDGSFDYSLPQDNTINVNVKTEKSSNEQMTDAFKAGAANRAARAAEAAAMSDASTTIKVPLEVDLNNYTHLALVTVDKFDWLWGGYNTKLVVKDFVKNLTASPLTIVSPIDEKKKFRKNRQHLKDNRNADWIYLYYSERKEGVDNNKSLILRDYKNKVLYSALHINTAINEVLYPLIGM
jgi:hypothetical protein